MVTAAKADAVLNALGALDLAGLRAEWVRRGLGVPPKIRTRDLLSLALAHRIQTRAFGGATPAVRRRLATLASGFDRSRSFKPTAQGLLAEGTVLIRDWAGQRHQVEVTRDGLLYQGKPVRSLSRAAFLITGTKWNGHVFFGLKQAFTEAAA